MKPRTLAIARLSFPLATAIAALLALPTTHAATYYWDNNGATAGFGTAAGTWSAPTVGSAMLGWGTVAAGTTAPTGSITTLNTNSTTDAVNFGSGATGLAAGTITVGTVNVGNMTFASGSGAIVLFGGTITLTAAQATTVDNAADTINSILAGAGTSFTKAGSGSLLLTGANSYTGTTIINGGTVNLGGGTATGSLASTVLTLGGGVLSYTRTDSQTKTLTTTNVNAGAAVPISVDSGNILNLGTVTRGTGGRADFSATGAGIVAADTASNDATGIMPGLRFGDTWAVANGAGLAISGLAGASYTLSSVAGTSGAGYINNIDVDNNAGVLDADIFANSLRFSVAAANAMTLTGPANVITSGGILIGSGVGSNLSTITGGTLAGAASKDLSIFQNNASGGLTISSIIGNSTGATALIKSGAGLLTLSASNTFTGGLIINAGKVTLDNPGALFSTPGSENAVTFGIGTSGTLALNGNSVVVRSLSTNSTTAGSAIMENASGTDATLTIGNSGNASGSFAGIIQDGTGSGKLALTKAGTGTLTLSGANTYTGGTALTAGAVAISNATSLGAGAVTVTGTTARINAVGGTTYANAINVGGALTFGLTTQNSTVTYSGQLTGASAITITGPGGNGLLAAQVFTNTSNTFTGNVIMPSGNTPGYDTFTFASIGDGGNFTLQKSGNQNTIAYTGSSNIVFNTRVLNIAATASVVYDGGGTNPVNMFANNGSGTVTFNTNMTVGAVTTGGGLVFGGTNTGNNTFGGTIPAGSGGLFGIAKTNAGKWILTGSNSYTGESQIRNGILSVNAIDVAANNQPLGKNSVIQIGHLADTGTLEFTGVTNSTTDKQVRMGNANANSGNAGGAIILNNGSHSLTFTNAAFNPTVATVIATRTLTLGGSYNGSNGTNQIQGVIQDNVLTTGKVALSASGSIWTLSGPSTYTGTTTIQAGSLVAGADSLGTGTTGAFGASSAGALVLGNASTLVGSAPSVLINGAFTVGRAITVGSVAAAGVAYNATIGGSNTTGTSTYTGNITLNTTANSYTATLQAATGGTVEFKTGTWATNNKAIAIGSSGNTGTVKISNAIATSGGISLNFGTLELNSAFTAGNMTVASGTTLKGTGSVAGTTGVTSGTVNGTGLTLTGLTTFNSSGNTLSGTVTSNVALASGAALANNGALTGNMTVGNGTLSGTGSVSGTTAVTSGTVNGTGLVLTGATTFNSTGNILSGTVTSNVALASGAALANNGALTGTLAVGNGTLTGTGGSVSGASTLNGGTINLTSGSFASTLGVTGGAWNGAGTVTGAVNSSSGTFTIGSGANLTASSGVSATGGSLVVNGTLTGTLTANSSTTVSGTGTVSGNATIQGTHSPGNSPGIQNFGSDLTYSGGSSVVNWELAGNTVSNNPNPSAIFDQIIVGGDLDFTNLTTINLAFNGVGSGVLWGDMLWDSSQSWLLYDVTGTTTNFANLSLTAFNWLDSGSNLFDTARPGGSFSLSQSGNDVFLNYTAVPEPNVAALLGGIGVLSLLRRRRA